MILYVMGILIFLVPHSLSMMPKIQSVLTNTLGVKGRKIIVGLTALIGIWFIARGWSDAGLDTEFAALYDPPEGLRHFMYLLMLPAFIFFFATYFPGKISKTLKHPMLISVKTWAFAHFLANGDVRSLILFSLFLAWAVFMYVYAKRNEVPNLAQKYQRRHTLTNDILAAVIGTAAYLIFMFKLHPILIGVSVLL